MATNEILHTIFTVRFNPGRDLLAVIVSWFLVTGALYTATFIVGSDAAGGILYFILYAVVTAALFGVGVPLYWTVVVRKRPLSDLGITTRLLGISLIIQVILAGVQYYAALRDATFPPMSELLPLIALALAIGFFEALFWRGWVQLRLEEAFGLIPALILGSALYALYHIGYGMSASEMVFSIFYRADVCNCLSADKKYIHSVAAFSTDGTVDHIDERKSSLAANCSPGIFRSLDPHVCHGMVCRSLLQETPAHDNPGASGCVNIFGFTQFGAG